MKQRLHLLVVDGVLEDLALHHVLVLIEEGAVAVMCGAAGTTLMVVAQDVEVLGAVEVHRVCQAERVETFLLNRVDVCVHIEFDLDIGDLTLGLNAGDYSL